MNRTLEEWIAIWEKRVGKKFEPDKRFKLFYLPDKGFSEIGVFSELTIIACCCGDGRYWQEIAEDIARKSGCKFCGAIYGGRKNFPAWMRLLGYNIDEVEEKEGFKRYHCSNKKHGGWLMMTECYVYKDGSHGGTVTWEVKGNGS